MTTLVSEIDDVRSIVGLLQSRTRAGTDVRTQLRRDALGAKARVGETASVYSGAGAGLASEHCTFTYLRSAQVPAGKTTSREPFANLSLASR